MELAYYTAETLEEELGEFERQYGIAKERFFAAYERDEIPEGVDDHDAFVWADLYREFCRLRGLSTARALLPAS